MSNDTIGIDDAAIASLSVAPDGNEHDAQGDAGEDTTIADRLNDDPDDSQARLDRGLDESMDASDPPALTQPDKGNDPAPSSGYDAEAERERARSTDD